MWVSKVPVLPERWPTWWHQCTVSDCSSWAWHIGEKFPTVTGSLGLGGIRRHGAGELTLTHSQTQVWEHAAFLRWKMREGQGWPGKSEIRCSWKCGWVLCALVTAEAMGSVLIFPFPGPLLYQGLPVSPFLIHSCPACHNNSFGSSRWPIKQSTSTFCCGFIPSFLLVFLRPVWFPKRVGWPRNSCPPLSEGRGEAKAQTPTVWEQALKPGGHLAACWREAPLSRSSLCFRDSTSSQEIQGRTLSLCSLPWCWYFPKQIQELKWEKEDDFSLWLSEKSVYSRD